jgi:translocation and assembly module TamB
LSALPLPPLPEPPEPHRFPAPPRRKRWKRVLAWIAGGLMLLLLLIAIGITVLLNNASFHSYVLRTAQQKATQALSTPVQLQNFTLHWSGISPTLDLYGVVIHGANPYPDPPLLQVDHLTLGLTINSLLHRSWYVNEVRVDRPVVRVFVDKQGVDNLPQSKSSGQKNKTSIFDLGVRHAMLNNGEIYYNNRKSVLYADLHDLNFQSTFDPSQTRYEGTLGYRNGTLRLETFNPMVHNLEARFAATPQAFTLERATLRSGSSQFILTATLEDYVHPKAHATYEAVLDGGQLRRIMKNPSLPVGLLRASGSLDYISQPNVPMLNTLTLNGDLSSRVLTLQTPSFRGEVHNIGAQYSLQKGNVLVRDIHADLLGGELTGTMTMRDITGSSRSELKAALRGISVAQAKSLMNASSLEQLALTGSVDANAHATWGKTFNDLAALADANIAASMVRKAGGNAIPLNGVIHASYAAPTRQISLTRSYIRTPQTSIALDGTVSDRSALQVRMQANDLHEIETLADLFRTPASAQPNQQLGLYGTATFEGAVQGSTTAPRLTGQLNAANLRLKGTAWRLLRTNVGLSPSAASLQNGELDPATKGRITFNVSTGLRHWSFTENSPFRAALNTSQINVADLVKAAGVQTPISGTLTANLNLNGSQLNPVGQGKISLTQAKIASEAVQAVNLNFQGTGDEVHANLTIQLPAGSTNGVLTYYPKQQGYQAELHTAGIRLDQLQTVKDRNLQLKGTLTLNATGRGTLNNPGLQANLQIPTLQIQNQTIHGLTLQTAMANHVANFALDSQVVNTYARARGTVNLSGDYYANATMDTQVIPLAPLVAAYAPAQAGNITGQTEIHATLRGPLKNKSLLEAHLTIPQLAANYKNTIQLAAAEPIRADFVNSVLTLQRSAIRGTGTDLQFQGTIPTNSAAPASLLLLGTVDLSLAQLFDPDLSSSGQLRFNINSYGQRNDPNVQGNIQIVNASFASGAVPIGLQNGNGTLTLTKNRLNVTEFTGTMGGGKVRASGGVVYRPAMQFDLGLSADGIRLLYPDGVRTALSSNLVLTGSTQAALLRGQVRIDQLSFLPDFDLMDFAGQFSGSSTPPPAQGFSQNLQLDIGVQSTSGINLVSRELSLQGAANLHVRGTAAEPVILGRVNLNSGDLIFRGNRYLLQGGAIDFVNPSRTQPVVDLGVNTTIQQYNIQMRFWGPADHLHTTYASDPALPPADIINLIALGKTIEAKNAEQPQPASLGAQSLIASQVSSQVTSRLEKVAGLSQLSVDPVLGGTGRNPGARVTIQQRATSKMFVTFSTDVTSTQRQAIKLEYQFTPRVSVNAVRDQNGGFGFDTRIRKVW